MSLEAQELQLKIATPIYPAVKVEYNHEQYTITYSSLVRKQSEEGIWYLIKQMGLFTLPPETYSTESYITHFHEQCYRFSILGRVDSMLVNIWGELLHTVDPNQESEQERLKLLYNG